ARRSEHEHGRAGHCGQSKFVASTPSEKADKGEAETGKAKLRLEWTIGPADKACGHCAEKDMVDKVYEVEKADWEQHIVGQKELADDVTVSWRWMAGNCDRGRNETEQEEFKTEFTQCEADDRVHLALCDSWLEPTRIGHLLSERGRHDLVVSRSTV